MPRLGLGEHHRREPAFRRRRGQNRRRVVELDAPAVEEAEEALQHPQVVSVEAHRERSAVSLPQRQELGLIAVEILAPHLVKLDTPRGEPQQKAPHPRDVLGRRALAQARFDVLGVERERTSRLGGYTALLVSVAKWRSGADLAHLQ